MAMLPPVTERLLALRAAQRDLARSFGATGAATSVTPRDDYELCLSAMATEHAETAIASAPLG